MDPTSSVGALLERDHERIDLLLTDFAGSLSNAAPDVETFTAAAHALRHHIYVEEEFHFPTVLEHGFEVQMLILIREHGQIWDALDKIETMLADPAVPLEHTMSAWRDFEFILAEHNRKEESLAYPAGDDLLPGELAVRAAERLLSGERPPDWACAMSQVRTQRTASTSSRHFSDDK
jgi:regulator of cell morphogenesis and NO signaling